MTPTLSTKVEDNMFAGRFPLDWMVHSALCWLLFVTNDYWYIERIQICVSYPLALSLQVLYIPKTNGNDTQADGGGYPASVSDTFEPRKFPCRIMGAGRYYACMRDNACWYATRAHTVPVCIRDSTTGISLVSKKYDLKPTASRWS